MLTVAHLGMGVDWRLPEAILSRIAPQISNRYLIGFSLGQVPPIWILALDIAQVGPFV